MRHWKHPLGVPVFLPGLVFQTRDVPPFSKKNQMLGIGVAPSQVEKSELEG